MAWYFENQMQDGAVDAFDGLSLVVWDEENKIQARTEFGCNIGHYNPYQDGDTPTFRQEEVRWL